MNENRVGFLLRDMTRSELKHYCIDNDITITKLLNDALEVQIGIIERGKIEKATKKADLEPLPDEVDEIERTPRPGG